MTNSSLRLYHIHPLHRLFRFAVLPALQREDPLDLLTSSAALSGMVFFIRTASLGSGFALLSLFVIYLLIGLIESAGVIGQQHIVLSAFEWVKNLLLISKCYPLDPYKGKNI